MDADLARIAFVSRRFNELKGLQSVAFGSALLIGLLLQSVATPASLSGADPRRSFGYANIALMLSLTALDPRYRQTFGTSVSDSMGDALNLMATSLPILLMLGMVGDAIGYLAHFGGPSAAGVAMAVGASVVLARDYRWRPHYAIPLVAATFAIAVTAATPPGQSFRSLDHDPHRAPIFLLAYTAMALATVVAGILDHRLLLSLLGGRASTPTQPLLNERAWRLGPRIAAVFSVAAGLALLLPAVFVAAGFLLVFALGLSAFVFTGVPGLADRIEVRGTSPSSVLGLHHPTLVVPQEVSPPFSRSTNWLWAVLALAIGAALDASRIGLPPLFLQLAFAGCSLTAAMTAWPRRRHYLLGLAASAVALGIGLYLQPAHALAVFVSLASAAVAIGMLVDRPLTWPSATARVGEPG